MKTEPLLKGLCGGLIELVLNEGSSRCRDYFLTASFATSLPALSAFLASAFTYVLATDLASALASALTGTAGVAGVAGVLANAAAENAPMINVARSLVMMFPSCCLKTPPIGSDHSTKRRTHMLTQIFKYLCQLSTCLSVDVGAGEVLN